MLHLYMFWNWRAVRRQNALPCVPAGRFDDALDDPTHNTWDAVLKSGKFKSKRDWAWFPDEIVACVWSARASRMMEKACPGHELLQHRSHDGWEPPLATADDGL